MNATDRKDLRFLFEQAWPKTPDERSAFLEEACVDDADLRQELEQLLGAYDNVSGFFGSIEGLRAYISHIGDVQSNEVHQASAQTVADPYGFVGRRVSHYFVESVLGAGGMGVVYKAEDVRLKRNVALKFLPPGWIKDERARSRFYREARAASALDHVNILTIHDIGEEGGLPFISMAFCDGVTLSEKLEDGPVTPEDTIEIGVQIASALAAAHRLDIIHRDIKPSNVMLTSDGVVKIVDFGLAKLSSSASSSTGGIAGTPVYMSPEQIRGEPLDHRTDIWSFGVLLYELLCGKRPFEGAYYHAIVYAILHERPDFDALREVPSELRHVIEKMLVADRERRVQSAEEALELLRRSRNGASGSTEPAVVERAPLRSSRVLSLSALALLLLVGLVVATWQATAPSGTAISSDDLVLVAEIRNGTDEEMLDHSITEAFRVTLRQSAHVNMLSSSRIAAAMARMRLPADQRLDDSTAVMMARREGVRAVIAGNLDRLGSSYVLTIKIIDPSSGDAVLINREEVDRAEDVLTAIDDLAARVRADLGESLADITRANEPLSQVTTSSFEALNLYSTASRHVLAGRLDDAIRAAEAAVAIDSNFAEAVGTLAMLYRRMGRNEEAIWYYRRVPALLDSVTDRERFRLLADYYGPRFQMDYERALENARQWATIYPHDALAHGMLGHLSMFVGETAQAIIHNQRSAELDPSMTGLLLGNSGFAQALAGRGAEAARLFRKSKLYRPDYAALDGFIAQALWMQGDLDSAEATFHSLFASADELRKIKTHAHLASLYCFRGQLRRAEGEVAAGLEAVQGSRRTGEASYFHYLDAEIARRRGDRERFVRSMREAVRSAASPYFDLALAGSSLAEMGYVQEAERALQLLRGAPDDDPYLTRRRADLERLVEGSIAEREGRLDDAAETYAAVEELHRGDAIFLTARLKAAGIEHLRGDPSAVRDVELLLARRGEAVMAFLPSVRDGGTWTSLLWPEAHVLAGRIHLELGDRERAHSHLTAATELWRSADDDFVYLQEARRLLAQARTDVSPFAN